MYFVFSFHSLFVFLVLFALILYILFVVYFYLFWYIVFFAMPSLIDMYSWYLCSCTIFLPFGISFYFIYISLGLIFFLRDFVIMYKFILALTANIPTAFFTAGHRRGFSFFLCVISASFLPNRWVYTLVIYVIRRSSLLWTDTVIRTGLIHR